LKLEMPNSQTRSGSFGSVDGEALGKTFSSFTKSGVPTPVTFRAQNEPTSKMKRYMSGGTYGIPSFDGRESNSAAARVRTLHDVVEDPEVLGYICVGYMVVQPGIEPTKRGITIRNTEVIKQ
jgi:hypothetical protein